MVYTRIRMKWDAAHPRPQKPLQAWEVKMRSIHFSSPKDGQPTLAVARWWTAFMFSLFMVIINAIIVAISLFATHTMSYVFFDPSQTATHDHTVFAVLSGIVCLISHIKWRQEYIKQGMALKILEAINYYLMSTALPENEQGAAMNLICDILDYFATTPARTTLVKYATDAGDEELKEDAGKLFVGVLINDFAAPKEKGASNLFKLSKDGMKVFSTLSQLTCGESQPPCNG